MAGYSVRDCAEEIIAAIGAHGTDTPALGAAIAPAMRRLAAIPDLIGYGIPREANHLPGSYYLYYDGRMSILLYQVPQGKTVAPHDHGIWETLFVLRGAIRHAVYERVDDGATPGHAELRATEDRVLQPGDFAIVGPPSDIHGFTAIGEDTWGITVVDGPYKPERHYYDPAAQTVAIKASRNVR